MSCTLYLETERTPNKKDSFDLIWSIAENTEWNQLEHIETYLTNDRLMAAIVNLGKALRVLADNDAANATIEIKTDSDGQDHRYSNEHNILYALVCPKDDFEALKLRSLHFEYNRYLGRIQQLRGKWDINIRLV